MRPCVSALERLVHRLIRVNWTFVWFRWMNTELIVSTQIPKPMVVLSDQRGCSELLSNERRASGWPHQKAARADHEIVWTCQVNDGSSNEWAVVQGPGSAPSRWAVQESWGILLSHADVINSFAGPGQNRVFQDTFHAREGYGRCTATGRHSCPAGNHFGVLLLQATLWLSGRNGILASGSNRHNRRERRNGKGALLQ